ncbi:hypothetical protein JX265_011287 [Neoarthrinium moseri]|uniref:Uncharacterized protein n=1 Tax=Neoarthrinium moseri TaxID=1658444 RepID=A0A9P9WCD6_9PEZI|nr:uncharacterized protein JN550_006345 [Neoarthrinium moseri]KAI1849049.1 hypothetical protein JX266_005010 [Neoarthrinium moseri]KAI1857086.1 hypothetical protein JX265_011287 [Neoarthrinium moseri]KAI1868429.1 hypothetical protein JN550_006345 [Neoarthrinium moseri]
MPDFFPFIPGSETSRTARQHASDSSPLLGRFRAVPRTSHRQRSSQHLRGLLAAGGGRGSVHVGYGALVTASLDSESDDGGSDYYDSDEDDDHWWDRAARAVGRNVRDLWVAPRQGAVRKVVESWWRRWGMLVFLPAGLAVAWCAIPFPQYPLNPDDSDRNPGSQRDHRAPGHGSARVQVNFWFFLFVYYGFYNLTALIWITKVFNLYSLNWWPSTLGFPLTVSMIAMLSIAAPIPVYMVPELNFLTIHNTAWISWTFIIMAMPVAIAFCIMMLHERHLGLRQSLSDTQRIFTSSWWTGEPDSVSSRPNRRRAGLSSSSFDPDSILQTSPPARGRIPAVVRRNWLPASFVRFVWFCLALTVGLLAYLIGEAYAEIYLRTLPHNNLETIVYVYSWVVTVHLLDALTGWILGASEGERVGSYPLSWIFKLYFMLTYQTYVRALYARLRSPTQFIMLQILSSSSLIILVPITMSSTYHRILGFLGLTTQSYASYQKLRIRDVFIRFLAENVSMLTFLGSILVLHFGANKDVYPYFAFDETGDERSYDFGLTFYASGITWACELIAGIVLRGLIRWIYGVNASVEGKLDLAVWPELLPTSVAVMLHVLQNMLFSIIRLHFH